MRRASDWAQTIAAAAAITEVNRLAPAIARTQAQAVSSAAIAAQVPVMITDAVQRLKFRTTLDLTPQLKASFQKPSFGYADAVFSTDLGVVELRLLLTKVATGIGQTILQVPPQLRPRVSTRVLALGELIVNTYQTAIIEVTLGLDGNLIYVGPDAQFDRLTVTMNYGIA